MAQTQEIQVNERTETGKGAAGRLRRAGSVPCVLYGRGVETVMLALPAAEINAVSHAHGMLTLKVSDGTTHSAMVRDIQLDHIKGDVKHIDFQIVRMDEKIVNSVPIVPFGDAAGEREGGIVEQAMHEMDVECFPQYLPDSIEVDVSALEIDDTLTIAQLTMPEHVEAVFSDPDQPVFHCAMPHMEEAEVAEGEEDGVAEPEVIGEKDEDEAEEE